MIPTSTPNHAPAFPADCRDFSLAAELVTPEAINFMATHG